MAGTMALHHEGMKPAASVDAVRNALDSRPGDIVVTIADAATLSGVTLAQAEAALHALTSEYRGHLRVTEEWETKDRLTLAWERIKSTALGALRFIVRAWVAIVLSGYALVFVALFIALAFSRSSDDRDGRSSFSFFGVVFRLLAEALFWTYHPFSPFRSDVEFSQPTRRSFSKSEQSPFYERVDRFFFGPPKAPADPLANQRAVLAEIRAGKGRIGLAEVMRATGLPRNQVDPLMAKLMTDYQGTVEVSEEGGIAYRFADLRKTALNDRSAPKLPVWKRPVAAPHLTGNELSSDLLIGGINAFNLVASGWVMLQGLTLERLFAILTRVAPSDLPPPGLPIALGLVPFLFSIALFLLPLGRLALQRRAKRKAAEERGRLAVLEAVLEGVKQPNGIDETQLRRRFAVAAGFEPDPKQLSKELLALGGDVDIAQLDKGVRYRFADLELERRAVEAEREAAAEEEAKVGKVVFSSED
jgi:hypothetical protein